MLTGRWDWMRWTLEGVRVYLWGGHWVEKVRFVVLVHKYHESHN